MHEKEPTLITSILPDKVTKKIASLQQLNHIFKNAINNDLTSHCTIAKQTKDSLIIIADNASWATNLRYAIPDIIKTLQIYPEFRNLQKIRYKIQKEFVPAISKPGKKDPKSAQYARMLKEFAYEQKSKTTN